MKTSREEASFTLAVAEAAAGRIAFLDCKGSGAVQLCPHDQNLLQPHEP